MKRLLALSFAVVLLAAPVNPAGAGFMLALSSPDDLANLVVGQKITLEVTLSGIAAGGPLDELGTDIHFPSSSFGVSNIIPEAIVPDSTGFSSGSGTDSATGIYDDLFANTGSPITSDGLFFSLTATALLAGSGSFSLANPSAFQGVNPVTVGDGTPGGGLEFNIAPSVSPTPAPGGITLIGSGIATLLAAGGIRGRRETMLSRLRAVATRVGRCLYSSVSRQSLEIHALTMDPSRGG
jgi:hypothetical protein